MQPKRMHIIMAYYYHDNMMISYDDDDTITVKNDGSAIVRDGGREKRMSRTRIISVPHFGKTGTVAMINLRTLECNPITFDVAE